MSSLAGVNHLFYSQIVTALLLSPLVVLLFYPDCFSGGGFVQGVSSVLEEEESSHGPVILRKKRAAAKEKNTCQLFIQTDHLFFRYYGTREAVIAQVCTSAHSMETGCKGPVSRI